MNVMLPPGRDGLDAPLGGAISARRSVRRFAPAPLALAEVASLLWAAAGVTSTDGRRAAPSAGATFPLETYLVAGDVTGLGPGVYRYLPAEHALTPVAGGDRRGALRDAALRQECVGRAPTVVVLAAVEARTGARYGERAGRYVAMEAGHAAQNLHLAAAALGLGSVAVGAFDDGAVATALGLPADHAPLYLLPVGRPLTSR